VLPRLVLEARNVLLAVLGGWLVVLLAVMTVVVVVRLLLG